jgi:chromosome segregation ATPase
VSTTAGDHTDSQSQGCNFALQLEALVTSGFGMQKKRARRQSKTTLLQRLENAELKQLAADAQKTSVQCALQQAHAQVRKLQDNFANVCKERDDAQFCLRESSHLNAELQARCRKLEQHGEQQQRSVEEQARSLRKRRATLDNFLHVRSIALHDAGEAKQQLACVESEAGALREEAARLTAELERSRLTRKEAEAHFQAKLDLAHCATADSEKQLVNVTAQRDELQESSEELNAELDDALEQVRQLLGHLEDSGAALAQMEQEREEALEGKQGMEEELLLVQAEYDACQEALQSLVEERGFLAVRAEEMEAQLQGGKDVAAELRQSFNELSADRSRLSAQCESLRAEANSAAEVASAADAAILDVSRRHEAVARDLESVQQALTDSQQERSELKTRVAEVEKKLEATQKEAEEAQEAAHVLEGCVSSVRADAQRLQDELSSAVVELESRKYTLESRAHELRTVQAKGAAQQRDIEEMRLERDNALAECNAARGTGERLVESMQLLRHELDEAKRAAEVQQLESQERERTRAELEVELHKAQCEVDKLSVRCSGLQDTRQKTEKQVADLEGVVAELRKQLSATRVALNDTDATMQEMAKRLMSVDAVRAKAEAQAGDLEKGATASWQEMEVLRSEMECIRAAETDARRSSAQLEAQVTRVTACLSDAKAQFDELAEERVLLLRVLGAQDVAVRGAKAASDSLMVQLRDAVDGISQQKQQLLQTQWCLEETELGEGGGDESREDGEQRQEDMQHATTAAVRELKYAMKELHLQVQSNVQALRVAEHESSQRVRELARVQAQVRCPSNLTNAAARGAAAQRAHGAMCVLNLAYLHCACPHW